MSSDEGAYVRSLRAKIAAPHTPDPEREFAEAELAWVIENIGAGAEWADLPASHAFPFHGRLALVTSGVGRVSLDVASWEPPEGALLRLPATLARSWQALPVLLTVSTSGEERVVLAVSQAAPTHVLREIAAYFSGRVDFLLAGSSDLAAAIRRLYPE